MKDDALARVIRPVVEGQIRSFLHAHPAVADAVDWRFSQPNKQEALVASIAKRISRDLLCEDTRRRMQAAMDLTTVADGGGNATAPEDAEPASCRGPAEDAYL